MAFKMKSNQEVVIALIECCTPLALSTIGLLNIIRIKNINIRKQPEQMKKSSLVLVVVYLWPNLLRDKGC